MKKDLIKLSVNNISINYIISFFLLLSIFSILIFVLNRKHKKSKHKKSKNNKFDGFIAINIEDQIFSKSSNPYLTKLPENKTEKVIENFCEYMLKNNKELEKMFSMEDISEENNNIFQLENKKLFEKFMKNSKFLEETNKGIDLKYGKLKSKCRINHKKQIELLSFFIIKMTEGILLNMKDHVNSISAEINLNDKNRCEINKYLVSHKDKLSIDELKYFKALIFDDLLITYFIKKQLKNISNTGTKLMNEIVVNKVIMNRVNYEDFKNNLYSNYNQLLEILINIYISIDLISHIDIFLNDNYTTLNKIYNK